MIFSIKEIDNQNSYGYQENFLKNWKKLIRETLNLIFFFKFYNYDSNIGEISLNLLISILKKNKKQ